MTEKRFSIPEETLYNGKLHESLVQWVADNAEVRNAKRGYIVCPSINHRVNPNILRASVLIAQAKYLFKIPPDQQPSVVFGVSNRGKEFAAATSLLLDLDNCVTDSVKDETSQGTPDSAYFDDKQDMVVIPGIPSFTKKGTFTHTIRGLRPNSNVAVMDDFCAYGKSSEIIHSALQKLGIRSHHLFLVAKDFPHLNPPQIGYRKLKTNGISTFSVVRFTDIKNGKVIATSEDL